MHVNILRFELIKYKKFKELIRIHRCLKYIPTGPIKV